MSVRRDDLTPCILTSYDEITDLCRDIMEALIEFVPDERQMEALGAVEQRLVTR